MDKKLVESAGIRLRGKHLPGAAYCQCCLQHWPCDTFILLEAYKELRKGEE